MTPSQESEAVPDRSFEKLHTSYGEVIEERDQLRSELADSQRWLREVETELAAMKFWKLRAVILERPLRELVALKDGPRDADYWRQKEAAWNRAREALAPTSEAP